MKHSIGAVMAAAALISAPVLAAHATNFVATGTVSDLTNPSFVITGTVSPLNISLTSPNSQTISNFVSLALDNDNTVNGSTYTDNISVALTFTQPGSATGNDPGAVADNFDFFWGGAIGNTASVSFGGPQTVTFADGALLQFTLGSDSNSNDQGWFYDPDDNTLSVSATFKDLHDPTAVPEPASIALLGTALVGLGAIRRRRRKTA